MRVRSIVDNLNFAVDAYNDCDTRFRCLVGWIKRAADDPVGAMLLTGCAAGSGQEDAGVTGQGGG